MRTAADWKGRVMVTIEKLREISPQEFALLGMQNVAYVKQVVVNDEPVFGIFAADGTQVALMPDRAIAFATVRQHEMEPVSVH
jgi:hypothetical protein